MILDEQVNESLFKLTPSQKILYDILKDGEPHSISELRPCLWDEMSEDIVVQVKISTLRKKIRPHGLTILSIKARTYQMFAYVKSMTVKPVV